MRLVLACLLTACAADDPRAALPFEQAPPLLPLELVAGEALAGQPMRVTVRSLPAGTTVHLTLSTQGLGSTCPPGLGGACLGVAAPVLRLGTLTAGPEGWASATFPVPAAVPDGRVFHLVALAQDINGRNYLSDPLRHITGGGGCGGGLPVCGVDGVTYPGACEAALAGWFVDHTGPC